MKEQWVKASEIGDFVYCKRGWWLKFNKLIAPNEKMIRGAEAHDTLTIDTSVYHKTKNLYLPFIFLGLVLLFVLIVILVW